MSALPFTVSLALAVTVACGGTPGPREPAPATEPAPRRRVPPPVMLVAPADEPAPPATAEEDAERARRLHAEGTRAYRDGDYELAIDDFSRAYELFPAPALLFNIAQAYHRLGDCTRANFFYARFAERADDRARRAVANVPRCTP